MNLKIFSFIKNLKYQHFSTTQYPFRILYLSTQIQIVIVYLKYSFSADLKDFRCTIINVHQICFENGYKYLSKNTPHTARISVLK